MAANSCHVSCGCGLWSASTYYTSTNTCSNSASTNNTDDKLTSNPTANLIPSGYLNKRDINCPFHRRGSRRLNLN